MTPNQAPLAVAYLPVASLVGAARNPRTHSPAQVEQIARSIAAFGWTNPVLVDEHQHIIAGHGRLEAARKLGMADVPTITLAGLSPDQRRALVIADNQLALNAGWDSELLALELGELGANSFDLSLIGFSDDELAAILADRTDGLTDPDDVPPTPDAPVSVLGDVWTLGRHRLVCGDATSEVDVSLCRGAQRIDMVLTDPPYCSGGFQEAGKASGSVGTRGDEMVANDTLSTRGYMALMRASLPAFQAGVVYVFTDWRMWINLFDVVESSGYGVRNMIVWDKGTPGMGAGWRMQHELIMCGVRVKSPFNPKKAQGNVIQAKRTGNKLHAVEKPASLLCEILEVTDLAKTVADPFAGSGTTIIAAEMTGRACHAIEISPAYCDVTVLRWQAFTGQTATHATTGRSFADTAAERATTPAEAA
ncbi:MAG TPA: DNA methyltransferase [Acetobacteraceae bacterium]|nr:DNA methyltransferase [Acetobacteraceae bacterium]